MKVILNDHVEHLGERGACVEVKPGYARNYLLPHGLAYLDTPGNRRLFDQQQDRWREMDLGRRTAAEAVQASMKGTELLFERRAGEKNVLFGSVTAADIGRELAEKGFDIDKRRVHLGEVIKELGSFEAVVRIHRDIDVTIPIHVVRPGGTVEEAEAAAVEEPDGGPAEEAEAEEPVAE
ncbi:MAG: 50S ribosomal protein L9 [Acidobacteria bacterium]|nr:50S ribosomal protein L9 [Acidobacteriota bacterium]